MLFSSKLWEVEANGLIILNRGLLENAWREML